LRKDIIPGPYAGKCNYREGRMPGKKSSRSTKIGSGRKFDAEKALREMRGKRKEIKAIIAQMRENKRVPREAMQRQIRN
jgi:hypothetical protein